MNQAPVVRFGPPNVRRFSNGSSLTGRSSSCRISASTSSGRSRRRRRRVEGGALVTLRGSWTLRRPWWWAT